MSRRYKQLSEEDRDRISLWQCQGKSLREIAKRLGRNASTISRELKRNGTPVNQRLYMPHLAQRRANARKAQGHVRDRLREPGLRAYVRRQIVRGWSPERIAGRWKLLGRGKISYEAIYQWIYREARVLAEMLPRAHKNRHRHHAYTGPRTSRIPSRTPLRERPAEIDLRQEIGHWENDTMIGRHCQSALLILVERKTRFTRLKKLQAKEAVAVRKAINGALGGYPSHVRRTITYDNGCENTHHLQVNAKLGTKSYFCEPMHSWEKGSVENAAGLVRRRLPKKTDFAILSRAELRKTERWLNGLPRKCLGFRTAAEAFRQGVALTG